VENGTEAVQLFSWEYVNGIFVAVCFEVSALYLERTGERLNKLTACWDAGHVRHFVKL
jgi:hypothetical protein